MTRRVTLSLQVLLCAILLGGCLGSSDPQVTLSIEPSAGYSPLQVRVEAHEVLGQSELVSHEWDLGDGSIATGPSVDHEFMGKGTIVVRFVGTDAQGRQTEALGAVRLLNRLPHAEFTYTPYQPPIHQPVRFDATGSFDPDGEILSYHWDFGDGATGDGVSVEHAFETPDLAYRVVLTVTDDSGDENEAYRWVEPIGCDH